MTKLTWDNAAIMSPADVEELDVKMGDIVRVAVNGRSLDLPVMPLPGVARGSIVVHLGYGRGFRGQICADAGFDVQELRTSGTMGFATGASVEATGEHYDLACTQDHHTIDTDTVGGKGVQQRLPTLYRESTLEHFIEHPDFAKHRVHAHSLSLFPEDNLSGAAYRWAMSIDLNACVGCLACVTACQAENNIPIVGKQQVIAGREMHWIRVDRYYAGHGEVELEHQPVPCMHCETAPCELVCPVGATQHSTDGLNEMIYNRCIGTRYCSNNCPYKVRRFNFLRFVDLTESLKLQRNPEVTVRGRGVMEKCTYCVQRIRRAEIEARKQDRPIADGEIRTACQAACPTQAIQFGDVANPDTEVSKWKREPHSYGLLEDRNLRPRTTYLARVRNPNDALAPKSSGERSAPRASANGGATRTQKGGTP
jgi:molybdopterin-containing oxidoreductase family iron-sulfur binding subunit